MTKLPYVQEYRDGNGKLRRYVRRAGKPLIPLSGRVGSRKFMKQYTAAVGGAELPQEPTGQIYFADDGLFIKIGFSKDTVSREAQLRVGSSRNVRIVASQPGTMRDEKALHRQFAHLRHRGEWFRKEPELLQHIGINTPSSWADA